MKTQFETFIETLKMLGFKEGHGNQLENDQYKIILKNTLQLVGVATPTAYTVFAFFSDSGKYYSFDCKAPQIEEQYKL